MRVKILILFGVLFSLKSFGQAFQLDFTTEETVCLDQTVGVENNSGYSGRYMWDFCSGDFLMAPIAVNATTTGPVINSLTGAAYIYEGNRWYGFFLNRANPGKIFRSSSPSLISSSNSAVVELSSVTGSLVNPESMDFIKGPDNIWYAYVGHLGIGSGIVRLKFGNGLNSEPTNIENIGDPENIRIRGLDLVEDNGSYYLITSNYNTNKISVYSLGSSPFGTIESAKIRISSSFSQLALPTGIEVVKENGEWLAYVVSQSNGALVRLNFGSSLENPPVFEKAYSLGLSQPRELRILKDGGSYYLVMGSEGESISIVDLGDLSLTYGVNRITHANLPKSFGYAVVDSASIKYIVTAATNKLNYFTFDKDCGSSTNYSDEVAPVFSYSQSGTYDITLTANDENGFTHSLTKQITVLDKKAPQVEILTEEIHCVTNVVELKAQNLTPLQNITSHTWTFPDGSQQTTDVASHQFTEPGTYKVLLNIESENGCGNYFEKEVTVYPEPQAVYELSASLACTNTGINFTNLTVFPVDSVIAYTWNFGDGTSSAEKSPEHTFEAVGTYPVILEASIPGCTTSSTQYVEVKAGPKTLFAASPVCDEQKVVFLNQTTGEDITGYEWELGDGTFSTVENPEHIYDASGSYLVILKSSNTLGCVSSHTQTLRVYSNPVPDFNSMPACAGSEVLFTDATIDADGNIEAWKWSFEMPDGTITESTTQNPAVKYPKAGTYGVTLAATTTWGCERTIRKTVVVKAVPEVAIGLEGGCLGVPSLLADWSETSGVKVQSWFWMVNKQVFTDSAFAYTFPVAGTYELLLQLNLENGCSVRDTREVLIDPLPEVDFTYSGSCPGQIATFSASAQATEYVWTVDGKVIIGEGSELQYTFKELGPHTVSLTVQDVKGCSNTLSKEIEVGQPPLAAFTADRNKGVPPFDVQFTNGSQDGATYQWLFGAGQESSEEEHPVYTFNEIGEYEVSLVTYNSAGCSDTTTQRISVVEPKFDVVLHSVNILQQNDQMQLVLSIENGGTILVRDMDIEVLINNEFVLTEKFEGVLEIGQKVNYPLRMQVNDSGKRKVRFICVELKPVLSLVSQELSVENNKKCPSLDQAFVMQDPFPNPGKDIVSLEFILPQAGTVSLTLYSVHGILVRQAELRDLKAHLNKVELDVNGLGKGIYFLRARFGTEEVNYRIMKD